MKKTKFNCHRIRHLLYLYRDGELSPKEKPIIDKHTKECSSCASILEKLHRTDYAIQQYRTQSIPKTDKDEVVNAAIQQVMKYKSRSTKYKVFPDSGLLATVVRPVLLSTIAAALCFLCFQQIRDAVRISTLENRLKQSGTAYVAEQSEDNVKSEIRALKWRNPERQNSPFSPQRSRAYVGSDLQNQVLSLWRHLIGKENDFIDYLLNRYPGLASITMDDGLSKEEREILSTEGRAFIRELEQLIKEGE